MDQSDGAPPPSGPTLAPCVVSEPGPSDTLIQRSLGTAQSTLLGFNGYGVRGRGRNTNIGPQSAPTQCQGLPRNKKNL